MKFFLDTADVAAIKAINELGVVDGVTTNPTIISREGRDFKTVIQEICEIVSGPVSAEVTGLTAPEMIAEARDIAKWADNVVVKIPMTTEGLKAVSVLSKEGIKTNVTLIFTVSHGYESWSYLHQSFCWTFGRYRNRCLSTDCRFAHDY